MYRALSGGLLSAAVVFGFASAGHAVEIEKSGNVYHKRVCVPAVGHAAACHAHIVTDSKGNVIFSSRPPVSGLGPTDLRDAYKITGNGKSSTIVAIVDAYGYTNAESDLGVYRSNFGLPSCTTQNGCFGKFNQKGQQSNYPGQNIGWAQESALDLDMASAMCPGCTIYLVEADTNSYSNLGTAENTAASLGAHVISNSYGGGEGGTQSYEQYYIHAGVAVTASTGDNGYAAGPQFPATSSHVTAVGGTHLTRDGSNRGWTESAWSGAGSGCSTVYSKPKWQKDKGCSKRVEADVSADADPSTGVAVYGPNNGGQSAWLVFGGTSVAAPMIAGIYGENGGKVKDDASLAYKRTKNLFDVTTGSNGSCGGSYLCTAMNGYDGPTGLGTPNGDGAFGK